MEKKYWNDKWENKPWDDEELRALQWKKLKKQIKYCYDNSPHFYQKKFKELGLEPRDIRTWEDFRNLPIFVAKEDERKTTEESLAKEGHPFGMFLCCPVGKVVGAASTGGTTGEPIFSIVVSENDLALWDEFMARAWWRAGVRPGDRVANIFAQCMHGGGWLYNHTLQAMGCCPLPVGAESGTERILRRLANDRPKALLGTPPLMEHLIERCPEVLGKPIGDLGIKILLGGGAPGAGIPSVRKKLTESYGCKLFDVAVCYASCDSEEYYGMHGLAPDIWIWPEDLVDPATEQPLELEDGVIGLGLQTWLGYEARPFLKYNIGDMLQVFTKECPGCGFKGLRFKIVGRADDMLIVKGINVYPEGIKGVVNSFLPRVTGEMRIVLDKPGPQVEPPLKLKVEHAEGLSEQELETLRQDIKQGIRLKLEITPEIQLMPSGSLGRELSKTAKQKLIEKTYEK